MGLPPSICFMNYNFFLKYQVFFQNEAATEQKTPYTPLFSGELYREFLHEGIVPKD
jgi:hypothetical protein